MRRRAKPQATLLFTFMESCNCSQRPSILFNLLIVSLSLIFTCKRGCSRRIYWTLKCKIDVNNGITRVQINTPRGAGVLYTTTLELVDRYVISVNPGLRYRERMLGGTTAMTVPMVHTSQKHVLVCVKLQ